MKSDMRLRDLFDALVYEGQQMAHRATNAYPAHLAQKWMEYKPSLGHDCKEEK